MQTTGRATPSRTLSCTSTSNRERRPTTLRHTVSDHTYTQVAHENLRSGFFKQIVVFPDVASADQQKTAGPQQDQDQKDEDVAMETEDQEEDLKAADVKELKPEQLDSTKASQKGVSISSSPASLCLCWL